MAFCFIVRQTWLLVCLRHCDAVVMLSTPMARTNQRNRLAGMELRNETHRLNGLHRLIKMCNTGVPDEPTQRLHASKRHLDNVQNYLRALSARMDYSRSGYTLVSTILNLSSNESQF